MRGGDRPMDRAGETARSYFSRLREWSGCMNCIYVTTQVFPACAGMSGAVEKRIIAARYSRQWWGKRKDHPLIDSDNDVP